MFFIGVFGIDQAQKEIRTINNTICPSCGAYTRLQVYKSYSYFHIFFIPTFRWNTKYYAQAACCGHMYIMDPMIGQQLERGENPNISPEHFQPVNQYSPIKICPTCRARVESEYKFCPHCGNRF